MTSHITSVAEAVRLADLAGALREVRNFSRADMRGDEVPHYIVHEAIVRWILGHRFPIANDEST